MSVLRLTRIEEVDELGDEWDRLVARGRRASPFLLRGWLVPWWREFGGDAELQVLCAYDSGSLVATLPLMVRTIGGVATAAFVGGKDAEVADLVADPRRDGEAARALVEAIDADLLHVFGLPRDSTLAAALAPDRIRLAMRAEAPRVSLAQGWKAVYNAKLSGQRRKLHRKRLRQLERHGELVLRVARTEDEIGPALEETFRLHELRWRGRPDRSGLTTPAGRRFHCAAARRMSAGDAARIALVELAGSAVGAFYYLRVGDRACATSMAYDPAFARCSPGWIATLLALETAADEGVREFEFLGGLEEYKVVLADELAPLHEGFALPRTAAARAHVAGRLATLRFRRTLKQVEPVRRAYYGFFEARRRLRSPVEPATDA